MAGPILEDRRSTKGYCTYVWATWSPGEAKNNPWWLEVAMRLNSEPCLTASVRGYAGKNAKTT